MKLLGGELIDWSARINLDESNADLRNYSALLGQILRKCVPGKSALCVGIARQEIVRLLADKYQQVIVLTPNSGNGHEIEDSSADLDNVTVICGAPERHLADGGYELVVAVAGLSETTTPDSSIQSERALLNQVCTWSAPGATVVVGLVNRHGLDESVRGVSNEYSIRGDRDWPAGSNSQKPMSLHELNAAGSENGFDHERLFAVYGSLNDVRILADSKALSNRPDSFLVETASRSFNAGWNEQTIRDPYVVARQNIGTAGLGMELAPAWLLVLSSGDFVDQLPNIFANPMMNPGAKASPLYCSVNDWIWRDSDNNEPTPITHETNSLADDWTRLIEANDRKAFADSCLKYVQFISQLNTQDQALFGCPSNVSLTADSKMQLIDSRMTLPQKVELTVAIAMNLRIFANDILRAGIRHMWSADLSPDELAVRLAATGGVDISQVLQEATEQELSLFRTFVDAQDLQAQELRVKLNQQYAEKLRSSMRGSQTLRQQINSNLYISDLTSSKQELSRQLLEARRNGAVLKSEIERLKGAWESKQQEMLKQKRRADANRGKVVDLKRSKSALENSRSYRLGQVISKPAKTFKRSQK